MRGLCYFLLSVLTQVSSSTVKVTGLFGHNVTLPCEYDAEAHGTLSFCWGRGKVPTSKCTDVILSSQYGAVTLRKSSRYWLLGKVEAGDVSLTILNAQWSDAGVYGCRVEIPGWFNDYKANRHLVIEEAPEENPVSEDWKASSTWIQETQPTSAPANVEVDDPAFHAIEFVRTEDEFTAFLEAGNIGRMAAIFFLTISIILVFIFRRRFQQRRKVQHLSPSADENIYESVPNLLNS